MSIGITGMNDSRESISKWNVCIPSDMDRDKYISNCFFTNTVYLTNGNGETVSAKVGKLDLQLIDFPIKDDLGSDIICVKMPYSSQLYVMKIFNTAKQYLKSKEDQFSFIQKHESGIAGVLVDGRGNIIMSVDGDSNNGTISINVTNKERKGKLNVNVNGDLSVENDGNTFIKTSTSFKVSFNDGTDSADIEVNKDGVLINSKKILLNDSKEPVLLGQKTVDLITKILDQLGKESAGPYPLLGNTFYLNLKTELEELKSKLSFVK